MWSTLLLTLPTRPNAVRVRVWRALKAIGAAALRDGVYLLPAERGALFEPVADDVRAHGGSAQVMRVEPASAAQRDEVLALFDRRDAYAQWRAGCDAIGAELPSIAEADARRRLRGAAQALADLQQTDHYPGAASAQAEVALGALREAVDARFSPGEPHARRGGPGIERLDAARFRGKRWATRARPWVDRLASAWLIGRFVDPQARYVWLADPARAPRGTVGFDFDGARFTHVGARVTFEVLLGSFGLDADPRLARIAAAVHYLDVGGIPAPEAAGLEAVLAGLRELHADDDRLLAAAAAVFDALLVAPAPGGPR